MKRNLNPDYIRRIMDKDTIAGLEAVFLTGEQFGVEVCNESLMVDGEWVDDDAPDRVARDRLNYKGWGEPGQLVCAKCWTPIVGIPRQIIKRNWCDNGGHHLYGADDEARLDTLGYDIYRDRVTRYTSLAARRLSESIHGAEYLLPHGGVESGYHKDHIFSVRDAFELNLAEQIVSSPPNLRVIDGAKNAAKGRRSGCSLAELLATYEAFLDDHPEWIQLLRESDSREETFVFDLDDDRFT